MQKLLVMLLVVQLPKTNKISIKIMISIVLGSFMGDEGKGLHNICAKNPENSLVIRFSGGHTVKYGDLMHTFSNFGSGTLLGVPTYWSEYCRPLHLKQWI